MCGKKEKQFKESLAQLNSIQLTKTEKKMFAYMLKAAYYSTYGVNNTQIVKACGISKRSVISILEKIREEGFLIDTKIGLYTYHQLDLKKDKPSKTLD